MDFPIDGNRDRGNSQEPSYFLNSLWHYCTLVSHCNLSSPWLDCNLVSHSKDRIYCHPVQFFCIYFAPVDAFQLFKREMSFTSHGKENTCLAVKTGTILHKKCFTIFSIVAHSDEYLHILLNIYLFTKNLNIYLFIIYLNIYLFIIYIFNPCRWRRQWSSWGL